MDLKMEINKDMLRKGIKKPGGKAVYPTKRTINLAAQLSPATSRRFEIALAIVLVVLVALFARFLVADPLMNAMNSSSQLQSARSELSALQSQITALQDIDADYDKYVVSGKTTEEIELHDRTDVVSLVDYIRTVLDVKSVSLSENTLTVVCNDADLDAAASVVSSLQSDSRISYVTLATATNNTTNSKGTTKTATFNITLKGATE